MDSSALGVECQNRVFLIYNQETRPGFKGRMTLLKVGKKSKNLYNQILISVITVIILL